MTTAPIIECVLVSSLAAVPGLLADKSAPGADGLYLELATGSDLKRVLGTPAGPRPGWLSVLTTGTLEAPDPTAAPVLLAPDPAVSVAVLEAAVATLSTLDRASVPTDGSIVLIVPVTSACELAVCLPYVDSFHLWWDVADLPGPALADAMRMLGGLPDMHTARFAGVRLAHSSSRPVADASRRHELMSAVLTEFSLAA